MRLPPELIAPPSGSIVSLAEAKAHLAVEHDEHDARIELAIAGVAAHLDGWSGILGRALLTQTWREHAPFWPASRTFRLSLAPAVPDDLAIGWRAADGTTGALPADAYRLLSGRSDPVVLIEMATVLPGLAHAPDAISITYTTGYGLAADIPAAIRSAALLMIGDLYRFSETALPGVSSAVPVSTTADRLLAPYRRIRL